MSRVGINPVTIPSGVDLKIDGLELTIEVNASDEGKASRRTLRSSASVIVHRCRATR